MCKRFATLVAGLIALSGTARAEPGDVVYARDGALVRQPVLEKGEAVEIAKLPPEMAEVDALVVSSDGRMLVARSGERYRWIDLSATSPRLRATVCAGRPSLGKDRLACSSSTGFVLVQALRSRQRSAVAADPDGARPVAGGLVHAGRGAIWRLDLPAWKRRKLAPHAPDAGLLVAPDGKTAVGVYPDPDDDGSPGLFVFRLDGEAARRKLMREATALAWSADSRWLLVQRDNRACIVRAAGGQYKCWRRYRAVALAPDGSWALVSRDGDLFRAELAGARARRPKPAIRGIAGPAVWLPK